MKVVLDSNVLLSAIGGRGLCESLLETCLDSHKVVLSDFILQEVQRGMGKKLHAPESVVQEAIELLRRQCQIVLPAAVAPSVCRDPDDLPILGTAVAGEVEALVTGDGDLLAVRSYKGIEILSPRDFYHRLK